MKAAVVPLLGGDWRVRDVAIPQPALDQVLIGVRASGLSSRTLSRRSRAGAGGLPSGGLQAAYRPRVRRRDHAQAADCLRQRRGRRTRETAAWVCPAELLRDHRRLPVPGLSCLSVALESPPAEVWAAHVERGNAGRRVGPIPCSRDARKSAAWSSREAEPVALTEVGITNRPKRISPPGSARAFQPPQTMELVRPKRRSPVPARHHAALPLDAVGIPDAADVVTRSRSPVPRPFRPLPPPEPGPRPRAKAARRGKVRTAWRGSGVGGGLGGGLGSHSGRFAARSPLAAGCGLDRQKERLDDLDQ